MKTLIAAATLIGTLGLGAAGAAQAEGVEIKDAVARVIVVPEARSDVKVEVSGGAGLPTLQVRNGFNNKIIVDGGLAHRIHGCSRRSSRDHYGEFNPLEPGDVR